MEIGACSREEPHPKFLLATIISPTCTFFTKSLSISSIQCVASSFGSEEFKYLAGMITSVSTLSPYLNTLPCAAFISYLTSFFSGIFYITSAGPEIFPVMALAAATAGLARYTSESTCPIRPTKLRFVVDTQRISAKTRSTGRCTYDCTCFDKDLKKSLFHGIQINLLGCRDYDHAESFGYFLSF